MTGRNGGADLSPLNEFEPCIILVRPQLAENIGATARAMGNGGLFHLRLVAPRDGWPQTRAWTTGAGAHRILENTKAYETVDDATADLHYVFATCPRPRHVIKPILSARSAAIELRMISQRRLTSGILFGPERSGLDNDDMARADTLIRYSLNPSFMSLNLAQAVMIMAYEWYLAKAPSPKRHLMTHETRIAKKGEINNFLNRLFEKLEKTSFLANDDKKIRMIHNLRHMFIRGEITEQEINTLHGIISALSHHL